MIKLLAGPLLGLLAYTIFPESGTAALVAGAAVWMAVWWMTEAISIYFTALLPLILFPLLGIAPMNTVAPQYTKEIIFLFIGGFLIAFGLERWNLHRRIALRLILLFGGTPSGILMGFVLSSYLLSMWISNTATVTCLLPALLAVIHQMDRQHGGSTHLAVPWLLGLTYGASIGGIATVVGTPPNLIFMSYFNDHYAGPTITFANWFAFAFPLSLVLLTVCLVVLRTLFRHSFKSEQIDEEYCRREYRELGSFSYQEKAVSVVFGTTVALWFFMKDLSFGFFSIPGWTSLPPFAAHADHIKESTIAMAMAGVLYLIPARSEPGGLIRWKEVQRLPVGILFLFGGGFALADSFETSGLLLSMGEGLGGLATLPPFVLVLLISVIVTFMTELMSNSPVTILFLPIVASLAATSQIEPVLLFVPMVLSASCAFMLPVGTPPNTIVFGTERLPLKEMMRVGIWLNLIFAILIAVAAFTLVDAVY